MKCDRDDKYARRGAIPGPAQAPASNHGTIPQHYLATQVATTHDVTAPMNGLVSQGSSDGGVNAVVNQLGGLGINGSAGVGPTGTIPGMMSPYVTAASDGQFMYSAGYPTTLPSFGYPQAPESANSTIAHPYLAPGGFPVYAPGPYGLVPFTPGRAGLVPELSDVNPRDVPSLENRRSSYSTNESTPATPFLAGSLAARGDQASRVAVFDRSTYTTPSPQQYLAAAPGGAQHSKGLYACSIPIDRNLDELVKRDPTIPLAVPAVFTPRESMKTLEQSLVNSISGNRNVYIRGLHPTTDDDLLLRYAERFGKVETSKAIIDTTTGACKGFGFAKFYDVRDSEACIRGFFRLGYEVGFARVSTPKPRAHHLVTFPIKNDGPSGVHDPTIKADGPLRFTTTNVDMDKLHPAVRNGIFTDPCSPLDPTLARGFCCRKHMLRCMPGNDTDLFRFQESFNSRLKAEGDDDSTNLYISNLPRHFSEAELVTVFIGFTILSSKILRDPLGNSRGVGFARFESREVCDQVIEEFQGLKLGPDGLAMQIRYADTPAQKELKRVTAERRQFRTNEYNVGAYGTTMVGMGPALYNQQQGSFRRNGNVLGSDPRQFNRGRRGVNGGGQSEPGNVVSGNAAAPSEDGTDDEGLTVHVESPLVAHGSSRSSPVKQEKE
ncbi:hypothetical protein F5Y16DRAFT_399305 [Xylariaceae sp. FL0255]|nr:hypothetical protein F5Y16DRAFT_399305 [Xylariaceae sp. FL0255]